MLSQIRFSFFNQFLENYLFFVQILFEYFLVFALFTSEQEQEYIPFYKYCVRHPPGLLQAKPLRGALRPYNSIVDANSLVQFSAARWGICILDICKLEMFNSCKLDSPATFPCECIYGCKGLRPQNLMDFPNGEEGGVVTLSVVGHLTSPKVVFNMLKSSVMGGLAAQYRGKWVYWK